MPEIQHYVPQFYLKYFAPEKNGSAVWAYQRNKKPILTNVKNVAGEKDFYIFIDSRTGKESDELEKTYSKLEVIAQQIINSLDIPGKVNLSREDKGNLTYFVTNLHIRGISHRKKNANAMGEMQKLTTQFRATRKDYFYKLMRESGVEKSDEEMEKLRQFVLKGEYEIRYNPRDSFFLKEAMEMEQSIYPHIAIKDIYLVNLPQNIKFVTSDNPVSVIPIKRPHPIYGGGGIADGLLSLPISPNRALLLTNSKSYIPDEILSEIHLKLINGYTLFNAHRFVFSDENSLETKRAFDRTKPGAGEKINISSPFTRAASRKRETR